MMKRLPWRFRIVVSALISLVPFNICRIALHRAVNGYHISWSARIGFGTVLAVDHANIGKANVLRFNRFEGPFHLTIADGAVIGPSNRFACLLDAARKDKDGAPIFPGKRCVIKSNAHVTEGHYIDATGGFELGSGSWVAGCGSQFWTHGVKNEPMVIGNGCYISSAVRFAPGSGIGNRVLVGLGSVVTRHFANSDVMIGGVPARIIRSMSTAESPSRGNPCPGD